MSTPLQGESYTADDQGPNTSVESRKGSQLCSMFCILTAMLTLGPRGPSDDPQSTVGSSCEPDIWTISYEVIMARTATLMELPLTDHRRPLEAQNDQGRDASPNGGALAEQILGKMNATPQEEVLQRIASLPPHPTRQGAGHPPANRGGNLRSGGSLGTNGRSDTRSDHCLIATALLLPA